MQCNSIKNFKFIIPLVLIVIVMIFFTSVQIFSLKDDLQLVDEINESLLNETLKPPISDIPIIDATSLMVNLSVWISILEKITVNENRKTIKIFSNPAIRTELNQQLDSLNSVIDSFKDGKYEEGLNYYHNNSGKIVSERLRIKEVPTFGKTPVTSIENTLIMHEINLKNSTFKIIALFDGLLFCVLVSMIYLRKNKTNQVK